MDKQLTCIDILEFVLYHKSLDYSIKQVLCGAMLRKEIISFKIVTKPNDMWVEITHIEPIKSIFKLLAVPQGTKGIYKLNKN